MRSSSIDATPRGRAITRGGVVGVNDARRIAVEALEAMVPTVEVAAEHLAVATSLGDLVAAVDDFLASTAGADEAEFESAVNGATDLGELAERVAAACRLLDQRAATLEVEADIRC